MNNYFIKAWDNYPYDISETIENLEYAISSEPDNALVYVLYGRIYAEQYKDYETAKSYYKEAMAKDINCLEIYSHYINTLIWNEDYEEAEKLIDFALKIKGSDKGTLYYCKIMLYEYQHKYDEAKALINIAKIEGYDDVFFSNLNDLKSRINKKIKLTQPQKKKKPKLKTPKVEDKKEKTKLSFFSRLFHKKK